MGDGPSESQAGDDPATFDDDGVGYGNVNTTTEQALANDPSINPNITVQDVQNFRSANTPSFTQQSQNYVDDFSGANIGSLPTSRSTSTASLPSTFERDYTKDYSDFNFANSNAAQGLRDNTNLTGGRLPFVDAIAGFPSQMTLNALNRGESPVYGPTVNGRMTGDFITDTTAIAPQTQGYIGGLANNQPGIIGGLNTAPQVQSFDNTINDGSDNNDPEIIRRRMAGEVIPEEELDPVLSDDLAVNYLQNPNYLYSGQGNLYQPYGYAQGTLVDLLRTRNLTQPQQAAANLGLFGNPGDFS